MKILVTGGDGQLGRALQDTLPTKQSFFTTRKDFDITDKKSVIQQIGRVRPEIVIHTAAYTNVDGCEKNRDLAFMVNVKGTENVADACKKNRATLIYISTDYVFDGRKKTPYTEKDKPNPLSFYGRTKLQGEEIVKRLSQFFIIRTAWLFGDGENFVQTILGLAKKQQVIKVVNDQIGCPTYAQDLATAIWQLVQKKPAFGIYHITNFGYCAWYQFAKEIIKLKKLKTKILPITTTEWQETRPESAKRPKYSVLDCSKIQNLGIKMRGWQEALQDYLKAF